MEYMGKFNIWFGEFENPFCVLQVLFIFPYFLLQLTTLKRVEVLLIVPHNTLYDKLKTSTHLLTILWFIHGNKVKKQ